MALDNVRGGADADPSVAVKILMKRHKISPVRIRVEQLLLAEHRSPTIITTQEDGRQSTRDLGSNFSSTFVSHLIRSGTRRENRRSISDRTSVASTMRN